MAKLTDELWRRAQELRLLGNGLTEISKELDVPRATLWGRFKSIQGVLVAEKSVTSPMSGEESWDLAARLNARQIKASKYRGRFVVHLGDKPVAISFISDQHISPGNIVDMAQMRVDAELVEATDGLYAILGGDGVDNHIKHHSAIIGARSKPDEQYRLYDEYLGWFQESIIALISGNHDDFTTQLAGVDVVRMLAEKNKIVAYSSKEIRGIISVGGVDYRIGLRHQYRFGSSFNLCHSVKRWYEHGEETFDIGVICHNHEHCLESFMRHGLERWAARPGAYQITSSYTKQFGFRDTSPTCPTFILYPKERRIEGFSNLQSASEYITYLRGKK